LIPAVEAFERAHAAARSFSDALDAMKSAASQGRDSTKDLVAKIGRASRLGERSLGVLDAGAVSCCLILTQLADSIKPRLT
ncbi:DAK2 domain-containing protein, partial [Pseudomonas carnis]